MDLNHLSDEQIQSYLDHAEHENRSEIENHLQKCSFCTHTLQIYKEIYHQLENDSIPDLSKNFSGTLVAKITAQQDKKTYFWENIIFCFLLLVSAVGTSYLINPIPLLRAIIKPLLNFYNSTLGQLQVQLNGGLTIIAGSIIIFILYEFLYNKLLKYRS
jgi:hypothetical protein